MLNHFGSERQSCRLVRIFVPRHIELMLAQEEEERMGPTGEGDLNERWRRHTFLDGLYQFYLDKIIGFHAFYLPIAGGVVAYVLANASRTVAFGLLIPFVVSSGAVWIFFVALAEARELNAAIQTSARAIPILATHAKILVHAIGAFVILHTIIVVGLAIGISVLLIYGHIPDLHVKPDCKPLRWVGSTST